MDNKMNANDETLIRAIIDVRAKAVHAGDVDALVADLADGVVSYDHARIGGQQ